MHYYQHNIKDFRSGAINFTRQERWLYRDMLDVYYDTERALPKDVQAVCDAIGASDDESAIVAKILRIKFKATDDGWTHERCETELESYRSKAETARENGKNGGRPSKNNPRKTQRVTDGFLSGSYPDAIRNPVETGLKANQEPITSNQEPKEGQHHSDAEAPGIVVERRASVVEAIQEEAPLALIAKKAEAPRVDFGEDARAVFSYWQTQRGHERAKLDDKRAKAIKARLKDGYTVGDLCRSIDGIAKSPHHMGQNDARTVYDDIELICRSAANVDKFVKLANEGASGGGLQRQGAILKDWI